MKKEKEKRLSLTAEELKRVFGGGDLYIKKIERELHVDIVDRNGELKITGTGSAPDRAADLILSLAGSRDEDIEEQRVDYGISLQSEGQADRSAQSVMETIDSDVICHTVAGKPVRPKTLGQKAYVDAIRDHLIVFGIGPAGTGKTYLAMAMAITAFLRGEVNRIILTRPAIEAGEKLGFLPGDLQSKVDPYLRPLYDALHQIMGADNFLKNMERGLIEVAPLAYMRGRTLDNAYIILDEAQNTTPEQMKMFLTRIGFGSKVVITGDATQKDLMPQVRSGLDVARVILKDIGDIAFCELTGKDVVRHPLVQKIVQAYEDYEKKQFPSRRKSGERSSSKHGKQ
ncbi:MAG: PhoH family protein [Lachnospiraceae bacterium]|nr:PhoH family protein [Lachnospiraceae bacterium]